MILGPDGLPTSSSQRFSRSATAGGSDRPWIPTKLADIQKLIPAHDRRTLVAVSRHMVENWGPTKAIARQIPMYSVGSSWRPSNLSKETAYKSEIEEFVRDQFCPIGDIRGGGRSILELFRNVAHCLVRDGEAFVLLTEYKTGFPACQLIPSHRIGSREYSWSPMKIEKGPYKGAFIEDGVISNSDGTVVAYRYLGDEAAEDFDISARSLIHCFDSDYPEAKRGYPMMAHGLNDARDSMQSHEWERLNMLWRSSIVAIENNADGIATSDHPSGYFEDIPAQEGAEKVNVKWIDGPGRTIHYKAGSGQKLELLKHDNPGEIYESFGDRMIHSICAGVPWPMSFVWSATGQGTAERRDIEQARRTITDIQSIIQPVAKRIFGYAAKKAVKIGAVSDSKDWWRWTFAFPAKLSIDPGRDTKATLELHARGVLSDADLIADRGYDGSEEEYWTQKFDSAAIKEKAFQAAQTKHGVELDPRIKGMWTPNDMGESAPTKKGKIEDELD